MIEATNILSPNEPEFKYRTDPCAFVREVLGMKNYPKQDAVLQSIVNHPRTALRAANGAGKSVVFAQAIIWFTSCFPNAKVVSTASTNRQVEEQLWGNVNQIYRNSLIPLGGEMLTKKLVFKESGSTAIGFSTDDPGLAEGWHAPYFFLLVDEAKSVSPAIFEAFDRVLSSGSLVRLVVGSSPGGSSGPFYECFHRDAHLYAKHHITAYDSPHINREWIEEMIAKHGENSAFVQSSVFGNFPLDAQDGNIISMSLLLKLHENPPAEEGDELRGGLDFAAGGRDESAFAIFKGNKQIAMETWHEPDTMATCGRVINIIKKFGINPISINADADGLGGPIIDRLHEQRCRVNRCHNGAAPANKSLYFNWGAESWLNVKNQIEARSIVLINDDKTNAQLTDRKNKPRSDGAIQLESKEELKSRGVPSPDRADAVVLARAANATVSIIEHNRMKAQFYKSVEDKNTRYRGVFRY